MMMSASLPRGGMVAPARPAGRSSRAPAPSQHRRLSLKTRMASEGRSEGAQAPSLDSLGNRIKDRVKTPWDFVTLPARVAAGALLQMPEDPVAEIRKGVDEARVIASDPRPIPAKAISVAQEAEYELEKLIVTGTEVETEVLSVVRGFLPDAVANMLPVPPPPPPTPEEEAEAAYVPFSGGDQDEAASLRKRQAAAAVESIVKEVVALRNAMEALDTVKADPEMKSKVPMREEDVAEMRKRLDRRLAEVGGLEVPEVPQLAVALREARLLSDEVAGNDGSD